MRLRVMLASAAAVALVASGSACGGGGGHIDWEWNAFLCDPADDGYVTSDGGVYTGGGIVVGDDDLDASARGFLRFDHSQIPAGSEVLEALLQVAEEDWTGTPFADLGGGVLVETVNIEFGLDASDYGTPALETLPGFLSTEALGGGAIRQFDVKDLMQERVLLGGTSVTFRLRFPDPTDFDGSTDRMRYESTESPFGHSQPSLLVRWR